MQVEIDKLELEVKRQTDMGLILAEQLVKKIDECEETWLSKIQVNAQLTDKIWECKQLKKECEDLKSEVARLNNLILSMEVK